MCSRYTSSKGVARFDSKSGQFVFEYKPRYNIAPTQLAPLIRMEGGRFTLAHMTWGWRAPWNSQLLINAKSETIQTKPSFRPYLHQRCLVIADGFYEWKTDKTPMRFVLPDRENFFIAALWKSDQPNASSGAPAPPTFTMLTCAANPSVAPIHTRMPLVLRGERAAAWLESDRDAEKILSNPDTPLLEVYSVNRAVSKSHNDSAELIEPDLSQPLLF